MRYSRAARSVVSCYTSIAGRESPVWVNVRLVPRDDIRGRPETTISSMTSDAELLAIQFQTAFVFERSGRISTTNDPDRSPAPRFVLFGCASGNIYGVGADVTDGIAAQLMGFAATEPPFIDPCGASRHLDRYIELLSRDAVVPRPSLGLTYVLPHDIAYQHDVRLICSDSVEGQGLCATLAGSGCTRRSREDGICRCLRVSGTPGVWPYDMAKWPQLRLQRVFLKRARVLDWLPRRG
jgi:hypothetical protein